MSERLLTTDPPPVALERPRRVLLIKPYRRTPTDTTSPPLGLLSLASALRRKFAGAPLDVAVVDFHLGGLDAAWLADNLRRLAPDVVGVSALNFEESESLRIAEAVKRHDPSILAVVGGPYALSQTRHIFDVSAYDWVVEGPAERNFPEALARHFAGEPIGDIPGVSWRNAGREHVTSSRDFFSDLDKLPMPAWDLVDFDAYGAKPSMSTVIRSRRYAALFTSRGCPYLCNYCHDLFSKQFAWRSAENVLAEIAHLHDAYGIEEFQVFDDIFNLHKPRLKKIMGETRRRWGGRVKFTFPNGLRADILDPETIDALVDGGTYHVAIAIETVTPRLQRLTEKFLDLEKARDAIQLFNERGVITTGFFMLGFPSETPQELEATIRFAAESGLTTAQFFNVVPQAQTPLHELAMKESPQATVACDRAQMEGSSYRSALSWYERAYGYPLGRAMLRASLRVHFSPRRIWQILSKYHAYSFYRVFVPFLKHLFWRPADRSARTA